MRVFAGPNGSGKTTIFKGILSENKVQLGVYVNADEIEERLIHSPILDITNFQIPISDQLVKDFFRHSTFSPIKRNEPDLWKYLHVRDNQLVVDASIDSYLAADIAELIRQQLLANGISFTYETVMSHPGKIYFFEQAIQTGFKVYLYFIATEDPEINVSRVNVRVAQAGHAVSPEVVRNRYYKSLSNLKDAVIQTSRAYIFDNSQKQARLIAEITNGTDVLRNDATDVPRWVDDYLLNK
jgi:predicted ABC-type ATPase